MKPEHQTVVDVIIPTYKPDEAFDRLLRGILRQDYPVSNIIIMNTEEAYYHQSVEDERIQVHHITREEFDHGATRQAGAAYSQADVLLFMTQDAVPVDDKLVSHLVEALSDEEVAVVYARQMPAGNCNINERNARRYNYPPVSCKKTKADLPRLGIKTFFCSDVCAAYVRSVFEELGGFPPRANFNEDMVYASKAICHGYGVYYCAEARVIHSHNYTGKQQFMRNFDMGASQTYFREVFERYPSEGEGIRMVATQAKQLLAQGNVIAVGHLIYMSACKYAGYRMGKAYPHLPKKVIEWCSTNPDFLLQSRLD